MATYFIDPRDGSNTNNGTTFALRRKTVAGLPTLASGDEIRFIANVAPYSIGTGTWTDNSFSISFGSLPVLELEDETNWTGVTNVTPTRNANRMTGTTFQRLTTVAAFTTGKMGYKTLPATLDLSAYDTISFMVSIPNGIQIGNTTLVLCSDTTGDVPVETIPFLPAETNGPSGVLTTVGTGTFNAVVYRKGSALSSTVNSIAIYTTVDPGSGATDFGNIIATTSVGGVVHTDLVGKQTVGEPFLFPVTGIHATTLEVGGWGISTVQRPAGNPNWRGVSESVTTYIQNTFMGMSTTADRTLTTPSSTTIARVSGGWDRTAMTSQTGMTYLSPPSVLATTSNAIPFSGTNQSITRMDHFGFVGWPLLHGSGLGTDIVDNVTLHGNLPMAPPFTAPNSGKRASWDFPYIVMAGAVNIGSAAGATGLPEVHIGTVHLSNSATAALQCETGAASPTWGRQTIRIDRISYSATYGISLSVSADLLNCTFTGNTTADVLVDRLSSSTNNSAGLIGCSANPTVLFANPTSVVTRYHNEVWDKDHVWRAHATTTNQSAVPPPIAAKALHTSIFTNSYYSSTMPGAVSLGKFAAPAGTYSITAALRRDGGTGSYAAIRVKAYSAPGITADQVSASPTATNTWETHGISVTTTDDAVIEVWALYGGQAGTNVYFGDLAWS